MIHNEIPTFPKIHNIGSPIIRTIFDNPVEISEKVDGSTLAFMIDSNNELRICNKSRPISAFAPPSMFSKGVEYIQSIQHMLLQNCVYYCEYLKKPKHNVLLYNKVPTNHLVLFGVYDIGNSTYRPWEVLLYEADNLSIDVVPKLYQGKISNVEQLHDLLATDSYLGGCKIEGVVIKNYNKNRVVDKKVVNLMVGKYVSEAFKEVHRHPKIKGNYGKGNWLAYTTAFNTEARWVKAIQHINEVNELEHTPKDIGKLIKEIHRDIIDECKEDIVAWLWDNFSKELLHTATNGFPEFYKEKLAVEAFNGTKEI